jgi:hypothetical protein
MTSPTQRALAARAVRVAEYMESWVNQIEREAADQNENVDWFSRKATVKLSALTIGEMLTVMRALSADIRKFERNLTGRHGRS